MVTNYSMTLTCSVLPRMTSRMPAVKLDVTSWNLPRDLQLADPGFNIPGDIDMLIGAEVYLDLLRDGFRKRNRAIFQLCITLDWDGYWMEEVHSNISNSTNKHNPESFVLQALQHWMDN
jgi:hypothetical protein